MKENEIVLKVGERYALSILTGEKNDSYKINTR